MQDLEFWESAFLIAAKNGATAPSAKAFADNSSIARKGAIEHFGHVYANPVLNELIGTRFVVAGNSKTHKAHGFFRNHAGQLMVLCVHGAGDTQILFEAYEVYRTSLSDKINDHG